ncbi:SatD family protein, partial [Microbacterium sp.]|uniref:SatD family protein n=1 Tax=Microbacterium sp. TaxID=51671 RepID=UPI003C7777F2
MVAVIIADIVGSKQIPDRPSAQRTLEAALAEVAEETPTAQRELLPTVGDELQGIYPDLSTAIATTLLVQLAVPVGIELRFGIGVGEIHDIPSVTGPLSEGEAWWAARAAIERVERLSRRAAPS